MFAVFGVYLRARLCVRLLWLMCARLRMSVIVRDGCDCVLCSMAVCVLVCCCVCQYVMLLYVVSLLILLLYVLLLCLWLCAVACAVVCAW